MARLGWSSVVLAVVGLGMLGNVSAAPRDADARDIYEQATAAFGLGRYTEAAEKYEQAFSLRPDPALLYNAAQSYRLAGNKPRALELYRNCLRLFPNFANADEARGHVATLKKEIDDEQTAKATPPTVTATAPVASVPVPSAVPEPTALPPVATTGPLGTPSVSVSPAAALVQTPQTAGSQMIPTVQPEKPIYQKAWFWGLVGAVVAGGVVGTLLATRGTKYPDASFGTANGN